MQAPPIPGGGQDGGRDAGAPPQARGADWWANVLITVGCAVVALMLLKRGAFPARATGASLGVGVAAAGGAGLGARAYRKGRKPDHAPAEAAHAASEQDDAPLEPDDAPVEAAHAASEQGDAPSELDDAPSGALVGPVPKPGSHSPAPRQC